MQSRWFNAATVMLWLATMSWLVSEKVLPPLLIGEPPNYRNIVEAQRDDPPVGWRMSFNAQPLGWALTETRLQPTGLTDIHGCVHFEALPLEDVMPVWLRSLTKLIRQPINGLKMDAKSVLVIDPLGHLLRFDSSVRVDPLNEVIRIQGEVEGRQLHLSVRSGNLTFFNDILLPANSLLSDALSPQSKLPGLRVGQTWTMPVYSPLWPAKNPIEIVHAQVQPTESIIWNGQSETCQLVVYQSDSGNPASQGQNPRGRLWARLDGTVLRQQVNLFDSIILFERLSDSGAAELTDSVGPFWWRDSDAFPGPHPLPQFHIHMHGRTRNIPPHMREFLSPADPLDILWRQLRYPRGPHMPGVMPNGSFANPMPTPEILPPGQYP
jgi:hypothetical protein